ncbi:ISEfa7, transposase [Enterococcus faecium]|nr:hypothetical protein [Enterococcus faecium]SMI43176.1 ISEfa7, transposase [Enterococcus faecium]SMI58696.1 ISEfa7, transposase [Enterococcus faecium]SML67768.1 ISEfa7, transposase [Enterococcus faecium]
MNDFTTEILKTLANKGDLNELFRVHLEKVATHTMLVFAAMNLKKLATWLWKGKEPLFFCSKIRNEVDKKLFQARVTSLEQLLSTV